MTKLIKNGDEWVHKETGEVFTKASLEDINNLNMLEENTKYLKNNMKYGLEGKYRIVKKPEKESTKMTVKEGYRFNMIHKTDMKELFLSDKLTNQDKQFIGVLSPFISYPDNDIKINQEYLTLEELGKFVGISKNIMTKVIKNLEEKEVIKVVKGAKRPPVIYFNPFLISAGREVDRDTYMMFSKSYYNPDLRYYV